MLKTILVPLDGSRFGEHALPIAVSLARRLEAGLRLVHVHVPLLDAIEVLDTSIEEQARLEEMSYLEELARRIKPTLPVAPTAHLLEGPVVASLEEGVSESKTDLVVMTTHGRGRFARFWLGSVADELVRHLTKPVLLIRPSDQAPELGSDVVYKRMVVALDGSSLSEAILDPALTVAQAMKSEVILLRVIEPLVTMEYRGFGQVEYLAGPLLEQLKELHERDQAEAQEYLQRVAASARERGLTVSTQVVTHEQPAQAILQYASEVKADLIALATHGRGGLTRLLLGSVADKVMRGAHSPILVFRPPQK